MGISVWQLLIVLAIVLVLFGAKRLKNIGTDIGGAIKGFKKAVKEEESKDGKTADQHLEKPDEENVFDVQAEEKKSAATTEQKDKV